MVIHYVALCVDVRYYIGISTLGLRVLINVSDTRI
jgi:hypothetical protein